MASSAVAAAAARSHIERMRRDRYYIGREEKNPLAEDMCQAVAYLSEELYAKDVHFLLELIQNAEDNDYPPGLAPSMEFVITSEDITETGANSTLLVFNNERGFSSANIDSICRVGRSTKKGERHRGYIGEKGIGFKSVFLISSQPHIFSNHYQIKFNEEPSPECGIGYIVPEWVEKNPSLSDIQQVYGSSKTLPTTIIILPLKSEKVAAVKQQLSSIHPEVLLFLSKIKRLSVREFNANPSLSSVGQISISSETDLHVRKNLDAESYTLQLSAQENGHGDEEECRYYMWKQKFPVKAESRVKKRMEADEWVITLAFPFGERLKRGSKPGVYAFLPTEMVTTFPFIIQADFLLASSRESILLDSPWNKGILNCVPNAFINALVSLVKSSDNAPPFSITSMFKFLPISCSSISLLENVRLSIKEKVRNENIMPCESQTKQMIFRKPGEVGRLLPAFWDILVKAEKMGVGLQTLSTHEIYILSSFFDTKEYDEVLSFLGVGYVESGWYAKCIQSSNLAKEVTEELYMELLCFIGDNWQNYFDRTNMKNIPLIKYAETNSEVSLLSVSRAGSYNERICICSVDKYISWLINWNTEFSATVKRFFMPTTTQRSLDVFSRKTTLWDWLTTYAKVEVLDVYQYACLLPPAITYNRKLAVVFAHFLYHSYSKKYIALSDINELCSSMPLVDNYGNVKASRTQVLVPAKGSQWVGLMGSNPWRSENYVELGADYLSTAKFGGIYTSQNELSSFLRNHVKASDVPNIRPPNVAFSTVSSPLTKENTFLLLKWIQNLISERALPDKFLHCIKKGCWLKTSLGYRAPSESFLSNSEWGKLLQMESVLVDIPMIDQHFYDNRIGDYREELRTMGVMLNFEEASAFIGKPLMSMAESSSMSRGNVFSLLKLIRFLREKCLPPEHLINSVKGGKWLKTSHGYLSPVGSVLFSYEWSAASYISALPFIDKDYYGDDILCFKSELELLGVMVSFNLNYQLVVDNIKLPTFLSSIPAESAYLVLECIRRVRPSEHLINNLMKSRWLITSLGTRTPRESFLVSKEWQCLLEVVDSVPLIDQNFYGDRIQSYKEELEMVGVVVRFEEASKAIAHRFKQLVSSSSLRKENVLAALACYRRLKEMQSGLPVELVNCFRSEKWLNTRHGFQNPMNSILYDSCWKPIALIASLPFIDDSDACYGKEIYKFKDELKALGAVVEFKEGAKFVVKGINIPKNPSDVTPSSVLSLLICIRNLKGLMEAGLCDEFIKRLRKKWLKTVMGYMSPYECILFDSKWGEFLQKEDGPFIDEAYYGLVILSYRNELQQIGVTVDIANGCSLLAQHIKRHSLRGSLNRIYMYLNEFKWKPENIASDLVWIPNGCDDGMWVSSANCVLHDMNNFFGSQLHVLEKYYDKKLLDFFSMTLGVRHSPTVNDYCELWKMWETSSQLKHAECSAFWGYIAKHRNQKTEKILADTVTKLPVRTGSGILLCDKKNVFIPDDLLLKDLLDEASEEPLFIWYPPESNPSLSRAKMNRIYSSIGVRSISEAIENDVTSKQEELKFEKVDPRQVLGSGLFKIILAFLANPSLDICCLERHQIVKCLVDLRVLETDKPITVSYSLKLSSGNVLKVKASCMFRWERENSKFLMQKIDRASGKEGSIKLATYFSRVISEGLLFEMADLIPALSELIKLGYLLDFNESAVEFLLKTKNLQLFLEDEEFLSSALSSD